MRLIETIKQKKYKTISIVGLAKNAGKTVALNYLIEESINNNLSIGITSTGRDGESIDLVTNTQKPPVYAVENMYAATAKNALMLSDARVEILETTGINTPMGEVVIVKIRQRGNIQIAGPVNSKDMKYVCKRLNYYGAEVVFVDGAVDRKAVSSPSVTDACILATGAVLSRDMKKVINITSHAVECYMLKGVREEIRKIILNENKTCIIQKTGEAIIPAVEINITGGKKISESIDGDTACVFIKGAVTSKLLKEICESEHLKNLVVAVEDGTKIFAEYDVWNALKRKGLRVQALNTAHVIAVTLNPVSPAGYFFDSTEFKSKISQYLPNVKIIDVVSGGEEL